MKEKFNELQEKYCNLSSAMIFSKLVKGRNMTNSEIRKWFKKLVNKDDWDGSNREEVVRFYVRLSNGLE
jgi:CRISPR/Cas system CSM-associated protein Csm2 small subunit